jgi:TrmH family RNA methyltransferase
MPETLVSEKNPLLKQVRRAVAQGSLTEDGFAVCEGFHLLEEALKSECAIGAVVAAEHAAGDLPQLGHRTRVVAVSQTVFRQLSSTETPQGVMALVKPRVWSMDDVLAGNSLALVLDGVQDPGNAGSVIRAAEAFGATGIVFLKGSVNPYNPKCLRASAGSVFRLPLLAALEDQELFPALDARGVRLFAAMPRGATSLPDADLSQPCAIVIGSEARGVAASLVSRAQALRIPVSQVESLNAAVAAGVLLYEARQQRSR